MPLPGRTAKVAAGRVMLEGLGAVAGDDPVAEYGTLAPRVKALLPFFR